MTRTLAPPIETGAEGVSRSVQKRWMMEFPIQAKECIGCQLSAGRLRLARSQGLLATIRSVYCGAAVIQESLMESLGLTAPKPPAEDAGPLSPRELDVLRLLARGLTNRAIARELRIGPRTADQHVHSIFIKTGVKSRTAAMRWSATSPRARGNPPDARSARSGR